MLRYVLFTCWFVQACAFGTSPFITTQPSQTTATRRFCPRTKTARPISFSSQKSTKSQQRRLTGIQMSKEVGEMEQNIMYFDDSLSCGKSLPARNGLGSVEQVRRRAHGFFVLFFFLIKTATTFYIYGSWLVALLRSWTSSRMDQYWIQVCQ